jgi:hypothetical protein
MAAIIAPLSVHSFSGGTRRVRPAAAHRSSAGARTRELAATPPTTTRVSTPCAVQGGDRLTGQHIGDRLLKRGGAVGHRQGLSSVPLRPTGRGGLQPGEREGVRIITRPGERPGEGDRAGVALARRPVDGRPAGVRQPEDPRDLVEALARRVVEGVAEVRDRIAGQIADEQQ